MNLLCPDCHSSISVEETEPWLHCESCGLKANLSRIETAAGSASFPMVKDLSGEQLGGYALQELIGVGGMGVVYKARPLRAGGEDVDDSADPVAVKVLNCDYHWQREEFVSRFQREAKALARLDHPNIVTLLDSGRVEDQYYLVTEYVDGVNLAQHLRNHELSMDEVVDLLTQVCGAITYAHEHGIVHRDIKPANVVISGDRAKVLDFGLAQITGGSTGLSSLTRTDLAMGTINYLSPEQRTNAKNVDERSDVFSLGVVLYEMLTGDLPLGGFEPASRARPEIGRQGDRIVARALEASPQRRYQSVAELAGDLRQLVQRPNVGRWVAVAVVALVAVGLGVGVWKLAPQGGGATATPHTSAQALVPGDQVPGASLDGAVGNGTGAAETKQPSTLRGIPSPGAPTQPAGANSVNGDKPTDLNDAIKDAKRIRGRPAVVVSSAGRRIPWSGGKGFYSLRKGERPVAIIDHKGQTWPLAKDATLGAVLRDWQYPGGIKARRALSKNVKRPVKASSGVKGDKKSAYLRRMALKAAKRRAMLGTKKGYQGGGKGGGKKGWYRRKGGKTKRPVKKGYTPMTARPRPAPPRYSPRK